MLFSLLTGYTEKEFINIYNEGVRNDQESMYGNKLYNNDKHSGRTNLEAWAPADNNIKNLIGRRAA